MSLIAPVANKAAISRAVPAWSRPAGLPGTGPPGSAVPGSAVPGIVTTGTAQQPEANPARPSSGPATTIRSDCSAASAMAGAKSTGWLS